jgi:hypothetical protein
VESLFVEDLEDWGDEAFEFETLLVGIGFDIFEVG